MIKYLIILDLRDLLYLAKIVCENLHGPSNLASSFHKQVCQSAKVTYSKFQYLLNLFLYEHIQITKDGTLLYLISFFVEKQIFVGIHTIKIASNILLSILVYVFNSMWRKGYTKKEEMCVIETPQGENSSVTHTS